MPTAPTATRASNSLPPALAYARLLTDVHRLIREGKGDSAEAEAFADQMDGPWHAMTGEEQARMRGLAADLHALRDGGSKRVNMSSNELAQWQDAFRKICPGGLIANVDTALNFLRKPAPSTLPAHFIPYLQSRCWERLGDVETALLLMLEADRLDPNRALDVLTLLQRLGRLNEAREYAKRVIENPVSGPLELYVAAAALLAPGCAKDDTDLVQLAIPALRRALSGCLLIPAHERPEPFDAESAIAHALGAALERLGDLNSAVQVYTDAIEREPRNGKLYTWRGLAKYELGSPKAVDDFNMAVRLRVAMIWPYLLLARHAFQTGAPGEALRLARMADNHSGPPAARAEVYEIIGMAQAELGYPQEEVLRYFDGALTLDPNNDRIRENREIASSVVFQSPGARTEQHNRLQAHRITAQELRGMHSDEIKNQLELFSEQRQDLQLQLSP